MNEKEPQNFDHIDLDRLHAAVKRETPEVQPGREPVPLWIYVGTWVVMILAGAYLGQNTLLAGFDFNSISPFPNNPIDVRPIEHHDGPALDEFQLAMKKGANVFNNCQGCHQATGLGIPGLNPPLAGSDWVQGGTARITRVVLRGMVGPVVVSGASFNSAMPSQGALSDKELSYVLTYIRNTWGNTGTMVTPEMVAKIRDAIADHPAPWNPADLDKFKAENVPGEIKAGPGATPPPAAGAAPAATGATPPAPAAAK